MTPSTLLLTLTLLSGANAPSDEGYTACPEERPQICTREYRPVCALLEDGTRDTRATGCTACSDPRVRGWIPEPCPDDVEPEPR